MAYRSAFVAGVISGLVLAILSLGLSVWREARAVPTAGNEGLPLRLSLPDGAGSVVLAPRPAAAPGDYERLRQRGLLMPVDGYDIGSLRDSYEESRGDHVHRAIDLLAPRGTIVRAVDDGVVLRLTSSPRGGIAVYQADAEGRYCYMYSHLQGYAPGLREGQTLRKGDCIAYVGATGNAPPESPHLHFAIARLHSPRRWWSGTTLNPYLVWTPDAAGTARPPTAVRPSS